MPRFVFVFVFVFFNAGEQTQLSKRLGKPTPPPQETVLLLKTRCPWKKLGVQALWLQFVIVAS
jgi:hypothetical protein